MEQRCKPDGLSRLPLSPAPRRALNNAVSLEPESHGFRLEFDHSVIDEVLKHLDHRRLSLQQFLELELPSLPKDAAASLLSFARHHVARHQIYVAHQQQQELSRGIQRPHLLAHEFQSLCRLHHLQFFLALPVSD